MFDFDNTPEQFGIVPIHNEELMASLNERTMSIDMKAVSLSSDLRYLAKCQRTLIPFLPVNSKEEKVLYKKLYQQYTREITYTGIIDFERFSIDWCASVDGRTVFPKLPVYLRTYFKSFQHTLKIKDAARNVQGEVAMLSQLNKNSANTISSAASTCAFTVRDKSSSNNAPASNNGNNAREIFIGGTNINPKSITFASTSKSPGRPLNAPNKVTNKAPHSNAPRTCRNCKFHGKDTDALTCPARFSGASCSKPDHPSLTEYRLQVARRKQKQVDKNQADSAMESVDATMTNSLSL